jgi:hypothetical protein
LDEGFLDAFTGAHSCILSGFCFLQRCHM